MGQAKIRGSRENRIAQAQTRTKETSREKEFPLLNRPLSYFDIIESQSKATHLFSNLTTPSEINTQVSHFAKMLSDSNPIFLTCSPEPWSRQSCCDSNVNKYIEVHGGKMLCGYRIWYNKPSYIEGERHAVWTDGKVIRDVSFAETGETRILFVPDGYGFEEKPGKVRHAFNDPDKEILEKFEITERMIPIKKMTTQECWDLMPTYEDWKNGKRMPNTIPILFS